jgi:TRAP-type uncharacterized transport system fused permease subunit
MALGLGLFLVPLGFVANPSLLLLAEAPGMALVATAKVAAALALLSFAVIGPDGKPSHRALALPLGVALLFGLGV